MFWDLLFRWMHMLAAIALVGGTFFLRFSLAPALEAQSAELRQTLLDAWRPRWARMVMLCSGWLLMSGLISAVRSIMAFDFPTAPYEMLVVVKLLIAMVIFWISSVLAGRSEMANKFREKLSFWLTVNVILMVGTVCLAGYMKTAERTPKAAETTLETTLLPAGATAPTDESQR